MFTATEFPTVSRTCKSLFAKNLILADGFVRYYTSEGKAVYMVAALGVIMDTETCQQRVYGGGQVESGPKHGNPD